MNPIRRAAQAVGGQSALARELNVTPQAVQRMCKTGRIRAELVLPVEKLSGVSRHELRPDLYPVEVEQGIESSDAQSVA